MPASISPAIDRNQAAFESAPQTQPLRTFVYLLALTALALAVHGYHLAVEDAAIYVPAIKQHLNPALYPFNAEFFLVQTRPMLFDELVAWSIKLTHLPFNWAIFLWHVLTVFAFLWATLRLARKCFADTAAQWSAVLMIAALLTMPISGTKLLLFDQYLHPRSISSVTIVLAAIDVLESRLWRAALWIAFTFLMHPLMAFLGAVWLVFLAWPSKKGLPANAAFIALPFARFFEPTSQGWREAMHSRVQYYLLQSWAWYMWLGAVAPPAILYAFSKLAGRTGNGVAARLCRRTALFGLFFLVGTIAMEMLGLVGLAPTQPMRSLHLVYYVMLLMAGGFLGQYVLRNRAWRWAALYLPLCVGLYIPERVLFAGGEHIEWPWTEPRNPWVQAFEWVRSNTPNDAIFALPPYAIDEPGAGFHGFRALAERSMLADRTKDAGLSVFSVQLADIWREQAHSTDGWEKFTATDFHRLRDKYNVTWVIVAGTHPATLDCPYKNGEVRVCRVP